MRESLTHISISHSSISRAGRSYIYMYNLYIPWFERTCSASDQGGPRAVLMIVLGRSSNPARAILVRKSIIKARPAREKFARIQSREFPRSNVDRWFENLFGNFACVLLRRRTFISQIKHKKTMHFKQLGSKEFSNSVERSGMNITDLSDKFLMFKPKVII